MHTYFDDADWKAAAARYKRSVALPDDRLVDGLDSIRTKFSGNDDYEPSTGGPTFEEIVKQSQASTGFRSVTDDPDANDCTGLREAIISGRWSVVQVVEAFLAKAALAQQVLGCYTEVYFDRARQRAIELDEELSKTKNKSSLGLLFGVPVSVKAHLAYQGSGSDRGFVFDVLDPTSVEKLLQKAQAQRSPTIPKSTLALLHKQGPHLMQKDGQMIGALLSEGAVIIGKTTMPQSIMHLDTRSNLHGQTLNPHNLHLSPGGSSGGEAASVASGATLAGLGTDIGGSVRQPAACVGLFGMRPTIGRFSSVGTRSTMPGNEGVIGTAGPFARSLRDLELLMSVLVKGTTESDPYLCPPLPWRGVQDVTQKKLRVGVMRHDGFVKPITPIRRALSSVEQRLNGNPAIELVYIDAKDLGERAWKLVRELYFMEDGALIKALASLTGEPLLKLTKYVLQSPVRDHTAGEAWELQYARETFKREAWRTLFYQNDPQQPLDVLLCPSSALVAPRPQRMPYWGYTSLFNLIDLPGITFPVKDMVTDAKKDVEFENEEARNTTNAEPLSEMDSIIRDEYERHRDVFDRAPLGLQLIGHRLREEELLGAMRLILKALS